MLRARTRSRRGTILIAVVVALVLIQLVVLGIVIAGSRQQDMTIRRLEGARAYYDTESAMSMAVREVARNADDDGDGTIGSIAGNTGGMGRTFTSTDIRALVSVARSGSSVTLTAAGSGGASARTLQANLTKSTGSLVPGLYSEYWENWISTCTDATYTSTPKWIAVTPLVSNSNRNDAPMWTGHNGQGWQARWRGKLTIPTSGAWQFRICSDDGSRLYINGTEVINNDFYQAVACRTGSITLSAGTVDIEVRFWEWGGQNACQLYWQSPSSASFTIIPPSAFTTTPQQIVPPLNVVTSLSVWGDGTATASCIDGFNSAVGPYGGSNVLNSAKVSVNSTASNAVQMSDNAKIKGDLLIGPGGTPSTVVAQWSGSSVMGSISNLTSMIAPVSQEVPLWTTIPGSVGNVSITSSISYGGNARTGSISISGNSTVVTVTGNVVWQVDGDFSMSNASQLVIQSNASLQMYVTGNVNFWNSTQANISTGNPAKLQIFLIGANRTVNVTDSAKVCAQVVNPFGAMNLYGTGTPPAEFFGTYSGNSLTITNKGLFHADVRTQAATGSGSGGGGMTLSAWFTP